MTRIVAVFAVALAGLAFAGNAAARECGIPDGKPVWVDFAGHDAPLPQKPGLTLAFTSGTEAPARARANGAATVFFDLNFNNRVGTPTAPADPAGIVAKVDRLFDFAVTVSGCTTPWIAENELFGAQTPAPWTPTTAQYRANTLILLRRLAERGAKVFITIANPPNMGGEAAQWWREVASVAVLVRQVYFTSPNVAGLHALGPVRASRSMRRGMRTLVRRFTDIGIPANRVALELQFHSAMGQGGREGLQPSWKWFEIVKLEALAVRQVTKELGLESIWSWGWATFSQAGIDRDKAAAACVYVWARDSRLCDGPKAAGAKFDASVGVGQLGALPKGVLCSLPEGDITTSAIAPLVRALRDRDVASSVMLERLVLQQEVPLDPRDVLTAELALVDDRYGGRLTAYLAALSRARLTRAAAQALLADELRRDTVRSRFAPRRPNAAAVAEFQATYGGLQARWVEVAQPVSWLGPRKRGIALETFAPLRVFALPRQAQVRTMRGRVQVRPLEASTYLGALPLLEARPAIELALKRFGQASVYDDWLAKAEQKALTEAICVGDDLPEPAAISLADLLLLAG